MAQGKERGDHVSGGSSGGSAVAVAAGTVVAALGSDTGMPSSFTYAWFLGCVATPLICPSSPVLLSCPMGNRWLGAPPCLLLRNSWMEADLRPMLPIWPCRVCKVATWSPATVASPKCQQCQGAVAAAELPFISHPPSCCTARAAHWIRLVSSPPASRTQPSWQMSCLGMMPMTAPALTCLPPPSSRSRGSVSTVCESESPTSITLQRSPTTSSAFGARCVPSASTRTEPIPPDSRSRSFLTCFALTTRVLNDLPTPPAAADGGAPDREWSGWRSWEQW